MEFKEDFITGDRFLCGENGKPWFRISQDGFRGAFSLYDMTGESERLMQAHSSVESAQIQAAMAYAARNLTRKGKGE